MLNQIVIMGRLTRDPEIRYVGAENRAVTTFSVAVDRDYSNGGEKKTDFFDCQAWRGTAEFVNKYFTKGSMIVVSGSLQFDDYTDRDGNKRRSARVVANNVYFGESKRDRDASGGYQAPRQSSGGYAPAPTAPVPDNDGFAPFDGDDDGELPF